MLMDPPREGAKEWMERIAEAAPDLLMYISAITYPDSGPGWVPEGMYELCALHGYDMFPMTGHMETLAVLRRKGGRRKMTDSIYWDAHHEADSEYRGAAVSSDSDVALLAYRGAAKRGNAFLARIEVESPAEIMGVHMSRDEPIWTRQFGGDWIFRKLWAMHSVL